MAAKSLHVVFVLAIGCGASSATTTATEPATTPEPAECDTLAPRARSGALSVRSASEMYLAMLPTSDCPTTDDLVREGTLSAEAGRDPWGEPYLVECTGEDIVVTSTHLDALHCR